MSRQYSAAILPSGLKSTCCPTTSPRMPSRTRVQNRDEIHARPGIIVPWYARRSPSRRVVHRAPLFPVDCRGEAFSEVVTIGEGSKQPNASPLPKRAEVGLRVGGVGVAVVQRAEDVALVCRGVGSGRGAGRGGVFGRRVHVPESGGELGIRTSRRAVRIGVL